jgi:hypothetical protein
LRVLPAMPLKIFLARQPSKVTLERSGDDYSFTGRLGDRPKSTIQDEFFIGEDVWAMRDSFMAISRPEQAFDFLSSHSPFVHPPDAERPWRLEWTEFQKWQRLLRFLSLHGFPLVVSEEFISEDPDLWKNRVAYFHDDPFPEDLKDFFYRKDLPQYTRDWLLNSASGIHIKEHEAIHMRLHPDDARALCTVMTFSVVDAILATIYFNGVVGIKTEKCAREGCENIFDKRPNHDHRFCSVKCGHTQSTRDRRSKAKELAAKLAAKSTKKFKRKPNG